MNSQQLLDSLPILGVFVVVAVVCLAAYEVGFRIGSWWQERTPDEKEGPTGMLVGFKNEDAGPFPDDKSVPILVERPAGFFRLMIPRR